MRSIQIAICDDEKEICGCLEEYLIEYLQKCGHKCEIEVFYEGNALCQEMKKKEYDLVFLDIELPDITGVKLGSFIREELGNEKVQIAYISAKQKYAMQLFEYRPINFLVKPLKKKDITKLIDKFLKITEHNEFTFDYKKGYEWHKVKYSDILYFQGQGRTVTLVTMKGTDTFYGSLERIYSQGLKDRKFIHIHKSYAVNYAYIRAFGAESVTLVNGETLPVSQSRRKTVKNIIENYMLEE